MNCEISQNNKKLKKNDNRKKHKAFEVSHKF